MSRSFRLAGLLRLRRLQEEQAAADLARANAERLAAVERRRVTAEMLGDSSLPALGDEATWKAAVAGRAALQGMVTESLVAIDLAAAQVDHAAGLWTEARTRATTLTKLEERHELAVRVEDDRLEQLVLDEAATRRATAPDPEGDR